MKFKIRDKRNKGWFWLDNEYLNGYAKYFGANGTAIYISLCRHSNSEQQCFPSQRLIAEELGIVERTVRKYIRLFEIYNLIEINKENNRKGGRWLNNVYTLTNKSTWILPEASVASRTIGNEQHSPEANNDTNQRQPLPTKKTNRKETNIKERKIKNTEERLKPIKEDIQKLVSTFKV